MRFVLKLLLKFVMMIVMVILMGGGLRYGMRYMTAVPGGGGMPGMAGVGGAANPQFSSDETDLMSCVFQSALRLFSGQASRTELASELSDKLYAGRAGAGDMAELGIELVKPGQGPTVPGTETGPGLTLPGAGAPNGQPGASPQASAVAQSGANGQPGAKIAARPGAPGAVGANGANAKPGAPNAAAAKSAPVDPRTAMLTRLWDRIKACGIELALIPVAFLGMMLASRIRRRKLGKDDFVPPSLTIQTPAETETYEMQHAVHGLTAEDFEMLVALVYQRQGYRVSMPSALSGGRGGSCNARN
jgi:hypothetical protein